jgi:glutathione synthase/RimK-type ligase-like ATP-grasp enzyme
MTDRRALEQALEAVEARLSGGAETIELQVERAGLLAALGRTELAKQRYLEILGRDPTHFATLTNFGVLLHETNFRTAARTLFGEAVARHPHEPLGHVNLANLLMYEDKLDQAREHYEIALRLDPENIHAHQRLSGLLHETGDLEAMRRHRRLGFAAQPIRTFPYLGEGAAIPLLVLTSTPAGDIAWPNLIDARVFAVTTLVVEFHDPTAPLPPHQLIFNAIGDADLSHQDLLAAKSLVERSGAPVINDPAKALATGRMANAERLGALPGVRTARMVTLARETFASDRVIELIAQEGMGFPLLLRSPGFHTGRHFMQVDRPETLASVAAVLPGPELMAMQYLDARGPDGLARKYRVMMIDGRLYPLHLAVSHDWKVHYATAAMSGDVALQAEEARFLEHMSEVVGVRGMAALRAIQATLGLDYGGVDFALDAAGEVLLFEANAVMKIVPPDGSSEWNYRRDAVDRASAAARRMVVDRGLQAVAASTAAISRPAG